MLIRVRASVPSLCSKYTSRRVRSRATPRPATARVFRFVPSRFAYERTRGERGAAGWLVDGAGEKGLLA